MTAVRATLYNLCRKLTTSRRISVSSSIRLALALLRLLLSRPGSYVVSRPACPSSATTGFSLVTPATCSGLRQQLA
jgi:hypothetical protein